MRIYITTLGCKLNQAEAEALGREATARGHSVLAGPAGAEWAIVNTCAVTHVAARKSRQLIRRLRTLEPALRVAVIGCYGELAAEELGAQGLADLVIPNAQKESVLDRLSGLEPPGERVIPLARPTSARRTRAFVKIQDGCDNACTYCIVHVARGAQRSRPPQAVLDEVRARVAEGYQEIVLTGVHIGAYGHDSAPGAPLPPERGWSLARLTAHLLEHTEVARLRLSSVEPWDVTPELVALWHEPRLCRQLHLPIQSGCDATLARMGRHYTAAELRALVERVRAAAPDMGLTTDVIVGFPGETEEEFAETCHLVEELGFSRLHVFKFSPRRGTPAVDLPGQVPPPVMQARSRRLSALGQTLAERFHAQLLGKELVVLFESCQTRGEARLWSGLTDHYVRVQAPSPLELHNRLVRVRALRADAGGIQGAVTWPSASALDTSPPDSYNNVVK